MSLRGRWVSAVAGLASLVFLLAAVPGLAARSTGGNSSWAEAFDDVPLHPAEAKCGGPCLCKRAALVNGWCARCSIGYIGGVPVPSAMLFEAIDPHGHEIVPSTIECPECQSALRTDGFCETCRYGFIDQRLYFSRLTWLVAQGRIVAGSAACRAHGRTAWCGPCRRGSIGSVVFDDPALYAAAVQEEQRLCESIDTLERCEVCATAMLMGSMCPFCRYDYR